MQYPPEVAAEDIAQHFSRAVRNARRAEQPYRHWNLDDVFPVDLCTGILTLPISPPELGQTDGTRGSYNTAALLHHAGDACQDSHAARRCRTLCSGRTWRG